MRKQNLLLAALALLMAACSPTTTSENTEATQEASVNDAHLADAPASLIKVLDTHGGYDTWAAQQTMTYAMAAKNEKHQIDLPTRKVRLEGDKWTIGYDGEGVWIQQDSSYFGGSARFYHNLYFYFIAMPFVLADPGITYEEVPAISFEGVDYPGVKISYGADVGDSPDDNYILYYHPETHQMEWLAYTVTYRSKEPSDNFRLIRYEDWKEVNGLVLPHQLTWFKYEDGEVVEPARDPMVVSDMSFSTTAMAETTYAKPEGAEVAAE